MSSRGITDKKLPYPENPGQTHFDGCWREPGHHNCAVALLYERMAEPPAARQRLPFDCAAPEYQQMCKAYEAACARLVALGEHPPTVD